MASGKTTFAVTFEASEIAALKSMQKKNGRPFSEQIHGALHQGLLALGFAWDGSSGRWTEPEDE